MDLKKERARAYAAAQAALAEMQKSSTAETIKAAHEAAAKVKEWDSLIAQEADARTALMQLAKDVKTQPLMSDGGGGQKRLARAATLGEHFAAHAQKSGTLHLFGSGTRHSIVAPEYKDDPPETPETPEDPGGGGDDGGGTGGGGSSNTDTQITGGPGGGLGYFLTEVDRTILRGVRRPTITNLFGQGRTTSQAITYFVEQGFQGNFETIAEEGKYPQVHFDDPKSVTDPISKIGAFIKLTDEMLEDLQFLVSEIDQRLLYNLSLVEEAQILSGNGVGTNLLGLLGRDGVQTVASDVDPDELPDEIFRSMTRISTQTGLRSDALVINPVDYEGIRLMRDDNNQYFGGGFFQGQYGAGGFAMEPPVWGLRTVVSPAVTPGLAVVGAFRPGATVYRKGGLSVEATNSNEDDFLHGRVTVRATEKLGLAVRYPGAFVKLTIGS